MTPRGKQSRGGWFGAFLAVVALLVRYRPWRRRFMFYLTLLTALQAAAGVTFLERSLSGSIWVFLAYWGWCMGMALLMMVLAVFDMLAVRREQQEELRRLRDSIFGRGTRS